LVVISLMMVVASASALQSVLALDAAYPVRVAAVAGGVLFAALVALGRWHPFPRLGPANILTGGRALVMALVAGVALAPEPPDSTWILVLLVSVGATADVFDGALARRSGLASRFGARFDMEVDALLVLVLAILVWRVAHVGSWIVAAGLMRYAFVAAGWRLPWMRMDLPPSRRRQAVCVVQIVALIVALVPGLPPPAGSIVSALGLALLTWSFAVDVLWLFVRRGATLAVR
jgi:phosphatidylglycerophosphate synthase